MSLSRRSPSAFTCVFCLVSPSAAGRRGFKALRLQTERGKGRLWSLARWNDALFTSHSDCCCAVSVLTCSQAYDIA